MKNTVENKSLFINGIWTEPIQQATIPVINPSTEEVIRKIGYGGKDDAALAVEAAEKAFREWSQFSVRERSNMLHHVADLLREKREQIGKVLAEESGKRLHEGIGEINFAAEYFQWFAEEIRRPHGHIVPSDVRNKSHIYYTEPAGVALTLTPWNFPISIQARKIAPALAAGCTVVARGSQLAPLSVIELFKCLEEAEFPDGVVNLIHGPGAQMTEALMSHPAVKVASFTGSTEIGKTIVQQSAKGLIRLALELGGDAPFIVFNDADMDKAVEGAMIAKFRNNGQSCIGANRFYIHDSVYDEFVTKFRESISAMKVSDPVNDLSSDLGPVIDLKNKDRLEQLVREAEEFGARRLTSDVKIPSIGYYVAPVMLDNIPSKCNLAQTEIFGPIVAVYRFSEEKEAIEKANNTNMGLAGYLYTNDISRIERLQRSLKVGVLGLNNALPSVAYAPMGGMKHSGLGREGARHGLEEYQEVKYVAQEFDL